MKFLKKLFIKNYRKKDDPTIHHSYGVVAGTIGIVCNVFVAIIGVIVGLLSDSISIIIQSLGNITDAGSSLITLIGFKLSTKPADKEHPFGHARVEYICGLVMTIIMLVVGILSTKTSIEKIFTPEEINIELYTFIVLSIIILTKLFLMLMYKNFSKDINSDTLMASSIDSRNDMIASIAILISMIIMRLTNINIDSYLGLAVSILIIISAIRMIKDTIDPLISVKPSKKLVNKIKKELLSFEGINDMHDLLVHTYGTGSTFVSVHVEVPETTTLLDCHELIDKIERHFEDNLHINLTMQVDPVSLTNPQSKEIEEKVEKSLKKLYKGLTIHGLRVIYSKDKTKVLFDILEDFNSHLTKKQIIKHLDNAFENEKTKFEFIFTIDKPFT
jgi:cation diffusion facilitator family transporter